MIKKIFLVHHTHLDIGFTDLPEEVMAQQLTYLDQVVQLCEDNPGYFWTIESGIMFRKYLEERSAKQWERFLNLLRRGQIELQAMDMQMLTETASAAELIANIERSVESGRKYGFPVECAMINDIGGYTGYLPSIMQQCGVQYLTAGVGACQAELPWAELPHLFYLESADKAKILVWNLGIDRTEESTDSRYPFAVYGMGGAWLINRGFREYLGISDNGVELNISEENSSGRLLSTEELLQELFARLKRENYLYEEVLLQYGGDNRGPAPRLNELLSKLKLSGKFPEIELTTPRKFFHLMEEKYGTTIPKCSGVITDPWNLRINSVPTSLRKYRAAQRLHDAALLRGGSDDSLLEYLLLMADHTLGLNNWGWHNIYNSQDGGLAAASFDRLRQSWDCKAHYAEAAVQKAEQLDRRTKGQLVVSNEQQIIVWNNAPHMRSGVVECYLGAYAPAILSVTTLDSKKVIQQITGLNRYTFQVNDVPPGGSKALLVHFADHYNSLPPDRPDQIPETVVTDYFTLEFNSSNGRLLQITDQKQQILLDEKSPFTLGDLICETISNYPMENEHCGLLPASERSLATATSTNCKFIADGPLFCTIRQAGKVGDADFERDIRIWKKKPRIDISLRLNKIESNKKESFHVVFPFAGQEGVFRFDQNVGIVEPQKDLLPGAMQDLFFCSRFASLETEKFTAVLCCPDAPVVEFGKISALQWSKNLPFIPASNHIYGMLCNNLCNTDAPAWNSVIDTFSYSLFFYDGHFDAAWAQACWESVTALNALYQFAPEQEEIKGVPECVRLHPSVSGELWLENLSAQHQPFTIHLRGEVFQGCLLPYELKKVQVTDKMCIEN